MRVKRWIWIVLGVVVVLLVAEHFLFETAAEPSAAYVIDVEALHRVATAQGPLPESIEVEKVGDFAFPGKIVVAGDPFATRPMVLLAHRVLWLDGRSLVIDSAMSPAAAKSIPGSKMDQAAFQRVEAALKDADTIVFTHEHPDHVGGVSSAPDFASIAKKVRITREQLNGPKLERGDFPPGALEQLTPVDYTGLFALAPGVVLQKAPGHSVGSQLIYVELANGTRFLFVGDIAWTYDNITRGIGRPGIAKLLMKEDRPAVAAQLRALAALPAYINIVVAHDPVALAKDLKAGLYSEGFNLTE